MKIIGGKDYYDGAGWGVDEEIKLVRKAAYRISDIGPDDFMDDHPFSHGMRYYDYRSDEVDDGSLRKFIVFFAGNLYPGVIHTTRTHRGFCPQIECIYDLDRVMEIVRKNLDAFSGIYLPELGGNPSKLQSYEHIFSTHFDWKLKKEDLDWAISNRVFVLSTHLNPHWGSHKKGALGVANHACLKEMEFFKVVDPATAHMELANFVGGVIPHNPETVTLSDKDRIRKAGFDTTRSFRNMPRM